MGVSTGSKYLACTIPMQQQIKEKLSIHFPTHRHTLIYYNIKVHSEYNTGT